MLSFKRNYRINTYNSIFEVHYPLSPRHYLEIIKTTREHSYGYAMSLLVTTLWSYCCGYILVPDLQNAEGREVICTGKMETALYYQCLTLCKQCICSLLPLSSLSPGQDTELSTYKDLRKRGRKHSPGPAERIKSLHLVFSIFCVVFPARILFPTWGR